jgi:hypothetical protein
MTNFTWDSHDKGLRKTATNTGHYVELDTDMYDDGPYGDQITVFGVINLTASLSGQRVFLFTGNDPDCQSWLDVSTSSTRPMELKLRDNAATTVTVTSTNYAVPTSGPVMFMASYDTNLSSNNMKLFLSHGGSTDEQTGSHAGGGGWTWTPVTALNLLTWRALDVRLMVIMDAFVSSSDTFSDLCAWATALVNPTATYTFPDVGPITLIFDDTRRIDTNETDIATNLGNINTLQTEMDTEEQIAKFRTSDIRVVHDGTNPHNEFDWSGGTVEYADSKNVQTTYSSIVSGTTGTVSGTEWIYFDPDVSTTVLQTSGTWPPAGGLEHQMTLIAIVKSNPSGAGEFGEIYNVFETDLIAANQVYAQYLSSIVADFGLITAGEARFGTGTPPTFTGVRLYSAGLEGYNGTANPEIYIDATDGSLYAGGGSVWMDSGGLNLDSPSPEDSTAVITWLTGGSTQVGRIASINSSGTYYLYAGARLENGLQLKSTSGGLVESQLIGATGVGFARVIADDDGYIRLQHDGAAVEINSSTNTYTLPTGRGTANYFLQTDGAGATSWAAAGSGSMDDFIIKGDTGGTSTIGDAETVYIKGTTGIATITDDLGTGTTEIEVAVDAASLTDMAGGVDADVDYIMVFDGGGSGTAKKERISEMMVGLASTSMASGDYIIFKDGGINGELKTANANTLGFSWSTASTLTDDAWGDSGTGDDVYLIVEDNGALKKIKFNDFLKEAFADAPDLTTPSSADWFIVLDNGTGDVYKADQIY